MWKRTSFFTWTFSESNSSYEIHQQNQSMSRELTRSRSFCTTLPAFEVIFAYNEASGTLDLFVQGDKKIRRAMEALFSRLVLKEELPDEEPDAERSSA